MNLRQLKREEIQGKVRIHWRDRSGATFGSLGRLLDISELGMGAELERRIEPGTVVHIESRDVHVAGVAVVRHCYQKGMGYRVGIQFNNRLNRQVHNLRENSRGRGD
ncbi:MAG: hypothetical protein C0504_05295 [Candidatus Solibacter sp.]|nr:hypothetical protein [Candidatus Solibacter sp.]